MTEKEQVVKEKVEHSGLFDLKGLYNYIYTWLKDENYDVTEDKYSENLTGNLRNIVIEWTAAKTLSDYFKHEIKVKFEIKELSEVEVEIEGKKRKSNKGKASVEVKGNFIKDPESKWDASPGYRFMRDVYNKYITPGRVDSSRGKLISDVQKIKEEVKAFLELSGKRAGM